MSRKHVSFKVDCVRYWSRLRLSGVVGTNILLLSLLPMSLALPSVLSGAPKTFIIRNTSRDIEQFRKVSELATRLKPYGRVQVEISALSDKSWYELPSGRSPWHQYGCYVAAPWKFFPHPKIAPHIPAEWVKANRDLMMEKAAILKSLGLEAMAYWKNSHMLPESFFEEYPHLRGPRVDHPRRSNREEFVWCTDLAETREMIEWMIAELKRNVPHLSVVFTGTNDSGSGLCWAAAQYPGPNGPDHCREVGVARRVGTLSETVHRGAEKGGGEITQRWGHTNFWANEMEIVLGNLPPRTFINANDPSLVISGTLINDAHPVRGMIDPLGVIQEVESLSDPAVETVLLMYCQEFYGRGDDLPEAIEKHLEILIDCLEQPARNLKERLDKLHNSALRWGGSEHSSRLFEAFHNLYGSLQLSEAMAPAYRRYIRFCPVSLRYVTRPLLIRPEVLLAKEEEYFLKHVFNVSVDDARSDYIDIHGGRMVGVSNWNNSAFKRSLRGVLDAAEVMSSCSGAPAEGWLKQMGLGFKIWVSAMRSIHNFYHAQLIRDQNAGLLSGASPEIPKRGSWTGHPDYLPWYAILRDEFDNVEELISLLEEGGLDLLVVARDRGLEDTFILGPDVLDQLKQKQMLMRKHWLDGQRYLYPPLK